MPNPNFDRLTRLNSQLGAPRVYHPPPQLPELLVKRFPELREWNERLDQWARKNFHGEVGGAKPDQSTVI